MYLVSDDYKQFIYAAKRRTTARVVFEVLDVDAFEDNTKAATSEAVVSRLTQTTNKVRGMSKKYATYEHNYLKLDGSFTIPPKPDQQPEAELGWWSGSISGADGTFNPHQVLEFVFSKDHSSMGISIAFDDATGEHAAEFDINVYAAGGSLIHSEEITDNTGPKYVLVKQLDNYRKVEVVIKKWATGYRRARVTEVDFGVVKEYADDKLIKLNMLKELSLTGETIPAGELIFTVDNSNKEFNILNPEGFYRFLQERQEAMLDMGIEVSPGTFEYLKLGKFYLFDWKSDEGSLTTTFTALDIIRLLDDYEMDSPTPDPKTIYALAEEVFATAGITDYEIDAALQNINTQAVYQKMTARTLLQHICVAGCAVPFPDRDGNLAIKQLSEMITGLRFDGVNDYVNCGKNYDIVNYVKASIKFQAEGAGGLTCSSDRYGFLVQIRDHNVFRVRLWDTGGAGTDFSVTTSQTIFDGETHVITFVYDGSNVEVFYDGNLVKQGSYNKALRAGNRILIGRYSGGGPEYFKGRVYEVSVCNSDGTVAHYKFNEGTGPTATDSAGDNDGTIYGATWIREYKKETVGDAVDSITFENSYQEPQIKLDKLISAVEVNIYDAGEIIDTYTLSNSPAKGELYKVDNPLINSQTVAQAVAQWILSTVNKRAIHEANWRQNPALDPGDIVEVESAYGTNKPVRIVKQEIEYQGYLAGKSELRGEIE